MPRTRTASDLLFVTGSMDVGGAQRSLCNLAEALASRGVRVTVAVVGPMGVPGFMDAARAAGVAIVSQFTAVLFVFAAILLYSAVKLLKGEDDSYDPGSSVAIRLLRKIIPVREEYAGTRFFVKELGRLLHAVLAGADRDDLGRNRTSASAAA